MLDETTDKNKNQIFFYNILGNSPISQMGLDNHGLCLAL